MDYFAEASRNLENILKELETTEETVNRDVKILKEWKKQEQHLPKDDEDDEVLKMILLRCKCRVEKTKKCVDAYYTYRSIWPTLFSNLVNVVPSKCHQIFVPLKKLTPRNERVLYWCVQNSNPDLYDIREGGDFLISLLELLNRYDCTTSLQVIIDQKNVTFEMITKTNIDITANLTKICMDAYAFHIKGMHFVNPKPYVSVIIAMLKSFMPQKIQERISVNEKIEDITNVIPLDVLPKELGGSSDSIKDLLGELDKIYAENKDLFRGMQKIKSNEALRIGKIYYEDKLFGVEGTFKKINLD